MAGVKVTSIIIVPDWFVMSSTLKLDPASMILTKLQQSSSSSKFASCRVSSVRVVIEGDVDRDSTRIPVQSSLIGLTS